MITGNGKLAFVINLVDEIFEKSDIKGEFISNKDIMIIKNKFPKNVSSSDIRALIMSRYATDTDVVEGKFRSQVTNKYEFGIMGVRLKNKQKDSL